MYVELRLQIAVWYTGVYLVLNYPKLANSNKLEFCLPFTRAFLIHLSCDQTIYNSNCLNLVTTYNVDGSEML